MNQPDPHNQDTSLLFKYNNVTYLADTDCLVALMKGLDITSNLEHIGVEICQHYYPHYNITEDYLALVITKQVSLKGQPPRTIRAEFYTVNTQHYSGDLSNRITAVHEAYKITGCPPHLSQDYEDSILHGELGWALEFLEDYCSCNTSYNFEGPKVLVHKNVISEIDTQCGHINKRHITDDTSQKLIYVVQPGADDPELTLGSEVYIHPDEVTFRLLAYSIPDKVDLYKHVSYPKYLYVEEPDLLTAYAAGADNNTITDILLCSSPEAESYINGIETDETITVMADLSTPPRVDGKCFIPPEAFLEAYGLCDEDYDRVDCLREVVLRRGEPDSFLEVVHRMTRHVPEVTWAAHLASLSPKSDITVLLPNLKQILNINTDTHDSQLLTLLYNIIAEHKDEPKSTFVHLSIVFKRTPADLRESQQIEVTDPIIAVVDDVDLSEDVDIIKQRTKFTHQTQLLGYKFVGEKCRDKLKLITSDN